jgi:hypothetical protein
MGPFKLVAPMKSGKSRPIFLTYGKHPEPLELFMILKIG